MFQKTMSQDAAVPGLFFSSIRCSSAPMSTLSAASTIFAALVQAADAFQSRDDADVCRHGQQPSPADLFAATPPPSSTGLQRPPPSSALRSGAPTGGSQPTVLRGRALLEGGSLIAMRVLVYGADRISFTDSQPRAAGNSLISRSAHLAGSRVLARPACLR